MTSETPTNVTMAEVVELVRLFNASGLKGLQLELGDLHLSLGEVATAPAVARSTSAAPVARVAASPAPAAAAQAAADTPAPAAAAAPAEVPVVPQDGSIEVIAPIVGTFWTAPSPGEPPFAQVGDHVEAGQQLAIIEVMKMMSSVTAPVSGTIADIQAANADLVEFEQLLFVIAPDAADD